MTTVTTTEPAPAQVVLLLGSNVDAPQQLDAASAELRRAFAVIAESTRHLSPANGAAGAPPYLNQAVVIECADDREPLKTRLRQIEQRLGRRRPSPDPQLCPIDIDAIGRRGPPFEVWDEKACVADYARQPLHELGIFCTLP